MKSMDDSHLEGAKAAAQRAIGPPWQCYRRGTTARRNVCLFEVDPAAIASSLKLGVS